MQYFNLYGPLNELGYGLFTRGLIKGLYENNEPNFFLNPIGNIDVESKEDEDKYTRQAGSFLWRRDCPAVAIWHEFDLCKFSSNKLIGFPIFETTSFNRQSLNYLYQMDAVFVMSEWAKNIVQNNVKDKPVFVIPGAANLVTTEDVLATTRNKSAFTFLYIGKYEYRKSPIETINAYLKAFKDSSANTRLIMHCFNPFDRNFNQTISKVFDMCGLKIVPSMATTSLVASSGNCIVEVILGRIPSYQVSKLYRHAHVGLFPSKAEGWNLPLMEGIQSGLPCIATNYSAHTEYLTKGYNYNQDLLLNEINMVPANDGVWFHGDRGNWASISEDELAAKMKFTFENYSEISSKFDNSKIVETFTWKNSAAKLLNAINEVRSF